MAPADRLVSSLRGAAQELISRRTFRDLDATLTQVVEAAVRLVPGADAGGISMNEQGRVTSRNPTTLGVTRLDQLQSELREGPCISAMHEPAEDGVILVEDLAGADERRWPRFATEAVAAGYRSMLSTQLVADDEFRAALNLYSSRPHAFDDEARRTAALFGLEAGAVLFGSEQLSQLERALQNRDLIGQAKGILIERYGVDDAEAFQMLVRASQDTNMKLVKVAEWLQTETLRNQTVKATGGDAGRR